jgi:hypothetical protein
MFAGLTSSTGAVFFRAINQSTFAKFITSNLILSSLSPSTRLCINAHNFPAMMHMAFYIQARLMCCSAT